MSFSKLYFFRNCTRLSEDLGLNASALSVIYLKIMATAVGPGGKSPTSLSRTLERVFEEAQHTGEIDLSGRKLKEYPKVGAKYDLTDSTVTGRL